MFTKDTFRLIKRSLNRFLSLVSIVIIGVGFMMGLLSTSIIMRNSVDKYNIDSNLHDIQLFSPYGFCDEDIEAIKKVDFIDGVFASKMQDVIIDVEDNGEKIVRLRELESDVNKFELIEGRLPMKADEAVYVVGEFAVFEIGDKITIYLEDSDVTEVIKNTEFTIVGKVKSSEYMSLFLSTSLLKNLDLDNVFYIPKVNFISDYYTTVYLSVRDAQKFQTTTDEYFNYVDKKGEDLEIITLDQQDFLKEKLLVEIENEIIEGEELFQERKAEGEKELEAAKMELEDANLMLILAQMEIDNNRMVLKANERKLQENEKLVDANLKQVNESINEIETAQGKSIDEVYNEITALYQTYKALERVGEIENETGDNIYSEIINQNNNLKLIINENKVLKQEYESQLTVVNNKLATETNPEEIAKLNSQKENLQNRINTCNITIETCQNIVDINETILENIDDYSDGETSPTKIAMDEIDEMAGGSIEVTYIQMTQLVQGKKDLEAAKLEIEEGKKQIADGKEQLDAAQKELDINKKEYLDGLEKYREGLIKFNNEIEKAENELKLARQQLKELPDAQWMILNRDYHYSSIMFKNTVKQMQSIGRILPLLFYLVAALICMTTMKRLIDEQRGQIGIFRALGFYKGQIIGKYVLYAFLATIIGSLAGITFGQLVFPVVIYNTWRLMYDLPELLISYPIKNMIICFVSFSGLMISVTTGVVSRSLKETPSQLMRPKAPKKAKKVFLEKIKFIWNKLSFTSKITVRNLFRYKSRFFMTVIGVAGCTGLLVLGFGIKDSISNIVNIQYNEFWNYNSIVHLENDHNVEEILLVLESDLDNDFIVPMMSYNGKVYCDRKEATITVEVLDARESSNIFNLYDSKTNERLRLNNNSVIVSEKFAKNNGLKAGDFIILESINGIKAEVQISDICKMYFQHYLYISEANYKHLFEENIHYTKIAIANAKGYEDVLERVEGVKNISAVTDFASFVDQFNTIVESLNIIIGAVIITSGALAFVVLLNLTQVNISERTREIATLKVIGLRDNEVYSYLFKEIILLSFIGGLAGLPLGTVALKLVMSIIEMEMILFPTQIKWLSYVLSYGITFIFTCIVLLFARKPLRKIQMVESLKSVE
ncbi:MAG: FtsX-like permease family protein [Erysipelotrichia bacterium]|jgi:putative ABC transport system permease protein|nr:FtsX-like permease family protein [Erysipelotrichia bacterium]